jgi:4,5-DOPA dioxygenase extradiol
MSKAMKIPSVFVSHGAPTLALDNHDETHLFLKQLGGQLPQPKAVLCVSAHWTTARPAVSTAVQPETIHDFYGFPDALYDILYAAPGAPDLAEQTLSLLSESGIECEAHATRGLDHGAWVPLMLMYPRADIPITQLSVMPKQGANVHYAIGRALRPLTEQGVLILASGGATHNLRDVEFRPDAATADYAKAFADWLRNAIVNNDREAILDYVEQGPYAVQNHPTPEHFLPLFVALGAASDDDTGSELYRAYAFRSLAMDAYAWA